MTVAAVVTGAPGAVDACRAALAAQTVAVELDVPDLAGCEHVWFLHGAARPEPDAQWTARVLAGGHGWWVTRSVAVAARCPAAPTASLGAKLRMLRSGAWTATEAIERLMPIDRADEPHPSRGR